MGTYIWPYQRIQHYSNPDVKYINQPTGTIESNDNGRKLEEESCTVENFRPYTPPPQLPTVYISGPRQGNNSGTYTWTAHGSQGQPPYSYQWKFSLNGVSYYNVGTGSSITSQLPYDNDLYIKVILTDANQDQATAYYYVFNSDAEGGPKNSVVVDKEASEGRPEAASVIQKVYPNPASNQLALDYLLNEDAEIQFTVTDMQGRIVFTNTYFKKAGSQTLDLARVHKPIATN
ncbi:MAG: T9SS type A sorting domain-containing protein [Bacteroidales bacterium]|nr:T9SS type A sorting domain-containing protein [Bacteroidales bacterium]